MHLSSHVQRSGVNLHLSCQRDKKASMASADTHASPAENEAAFCSDRPVTPYQCAKVPQFQLTEQQLEFGPVASVLAESRTTFLKRRKKKSVNSVHTYSNAIQKSSHIISHHSERLESLTCTAPLSMIWRFNVQTQRPGQTSEPLTSRPRGGARLFLSPRRPH